MAGRRSRRKFEPGGGGERGEKTVDGYFVTEGSLEGEIRGKEVGEIREVGTIRLTDTTQC